MIGALYLGFLRANKLWVSWLAESDGSARMCACALGTIPWTLVIRRILFIKCIRPSCITMWFIKRMHLLGRGLTRN